MKTGLNFCPFYAEQQKDNGCGGNSKCEIQNGFGMLSLIIVKLIL